MPCQRNCFWNSALKRATETGLRLSKTFNYCKIIGSHARWWNDLVFNGNFIPFHRVENNARAVSPWWNYLFLSFFVSCKKYSFTDMTLNMHTWHLVKSRWVTEDHPRADRSSNASIYSSTEYVGNTTLRDLPDASRRAAQPSSNGPQVAQAFWPARVSHHRDKIVALVLKKKYKKILGYSSHQVKGGPTKYGRWTTAYTIGQMVSFTLNILI